MSLIMYLLALLIPATAGDTAPEDIGTVPIVGIAYPGFGAESEDFTVLILGVYVGGGWRGLPVSYEWEKSKDVLAAPDAGTREVLGAIMRTTLYNSSNTAEKFVPGSLEFTHVVASTFVGLKGEFPDARPAGTEGPTEPYYLLTANKDCPTLKRLAVSDVAGLRAHVLREIDTHASSFDPGSPLSEKFSETLEGLSAYETFAQIAIKVNNERDLEGLFSTEAMREKLKPFDLAPEDVSKYLSEQLLTPGQALKNSERARVIAILRIFALAIDEAEEARVGDARAFDPAMLEAPVFQDVIPFDMAGKRKAVWVNTSRAYPTELTPSDDPLDKGMWSAYYYGVVEQLADGELKPLWELSGIYGGNEGPRINLIGICDAEGDGNPEVAIRAGGEEWDAYELLTYTEGVYTVAARAWGAL